MTEKERPIRVVEPTVIDREGNEIPGTGEGSARSRRGGHGFVFQMGTPGGIWPYLLAVIIPVILVFGFAVFAGIAAVTVTLLLIRTVLRAVFRSMK